MEIWKDIEGYPGYQVSNKGNVRSLNYNHTGKPHILKQRRSHNGYWRVGLHKNGLQKSYFVSRLILETFVGPAPADKPFCGHIDENFDNNCLENLKWMSCKENNNFTGHKEKLGKALTNRKDESIPVVAYYTNGKYIGKFPSMSEAARQLGIRKSEVSKVYRGDALQTHGMIFKKPLE